MTIIYPTIKEMPITGLSGLGGGVGTLLTGGVKVVVYGGDACPTMYWTAYGGTGAGVYTGALGDEITDHCSSNVLSDDNSAWVSTLDLGSDTAYDQLYFSSSSVSTQSNMEVWASNSNTFGSGNVQLGTGAGWPTSNSGIHSTTVSGTRYRYVRFNNFPGWNYAVTMQKPV